MKKYYLPTLVICIASGLISFTVVKNYMQWQTPLEVDTRPAIKVIMPKLEAPMIEIELKNHRAFLNKIGNYESGNRYQVVNRWGYLGKYQFHQETLKSLGINVSKSKFLSSPTLQEEAMSRLLKDNHRNLKRFIRKYDGKVVHGVLVTESGVLAAAHLGGAGNVRNWFRNGEDFEDGNGTPITKYMKVFRGYELDL
jgi:hypothetical protein